MPEKNDAKRAAVNAEEAVAERSAKALAELYRAFKVLAFYPEKHPLRKDILDRAYGALKGLMIGTGLSLIVRRSGLSFADRSDNIENIHMTMALAHELFRREIQRLAFLPELSLSDLNSFLILLGREPQRIISDGGMEKLLASSDITTISVNEINISAVFSKRFTSDSAETGFPDGNYSGEREEPQQETASEEVVTEGPPVLDGIPLDRLAGLTAKELFLLLEKECEETRYVRLARMLENKGLSLTENGEFDLLFPILIGLLDQSADGERSVVCREAAKETFRALAGDDMLEHLLDNLEDETFDQREFVYHVLKCLGGETVAAVIHRIAFSGSGDSGKALGAVLVRMGTAALPALLKLLKDDRRQVVRASASVLGEIGSRNAVKGLMLTAYHADTRVRIESVRSLALIGGDEATQVLVDILRENNRVVRRQAILWLGITGNQKALGALLQFAMKRDFPGKLIALKKEALLAIGRIGSPEALETLFRVVDKRRILFPGRWLALKVLALETIARVGGDEARDFLRKTSLRGGRIGRVSSALLETMEEEG